jgi:hypothetical protein
MSRNESQPARTAPSEYQARAAEAEMLARRALSEAEQKAYREIARIWLDMAERVGPSNER